MVPLPVKTIHGHSGKLFGEAGILLRNMQHDTSATISTVSTAEESSNMHSAGCGMNHAEARGEAHSRHEHDFARPPRSRQRQNIQHPRRRQSKVLLQFLTSGPDLACRCAARCRDVRRETKARLAMVRVSEAG